MFEKITAFIERHQSFIITTHDPPDADGIGSELVLLSILNQKKKEARIFNSSNTPANIQFMTVNANIEKWDSSMKTSEEYINLFANSALLILDTSDEYHMGLIREAAKMVKEVFYIDHHESKPTSKFSGFVDSSASSTAELVIELACSMDITLDSHTASAAYTGLVFDTGFFSYPKTSARSFKTAVKTLEWGAVPNQVYRQLMEASSCAAVLLQKQALSNLEFFADRRIALMSLSVEDFKKAGAEFEDVEKIVNIPLKAREIEVSLLIREKSTGEVFCSLRSKGKVNASKVAQEFSGGGHVTAAGFRSLDSMETVRKKIIQCLEAYLR